MSQGDNGRVTMAVLKRDIEHLTRAVEALRVEVCEQRKEDGTRLSGLERWEQTSRERWDAHREQHTRENTQLAVGNGIASTFVSAIAALVGVFVERT